jgi:DNA-binding XRE family transcriptional regulator
MRLGLTQAAAGKKLGLPQTVVSAIERGARGISLRQALAYQRVARIKQIDWTIDDDQQSNSMAKHSDRAAAPRRG